MQVGHGAEAAAEPPAANVSGSPAPQWMRYRCRHHLPFIRSWKTTSSRPHVLTTSQ
jgi:hypothetical protein